ncbi:MAG: iron ABC transporter permease [Pirellulales bacterium]|nr:iron ABC transporter permease [Pirellulales bacterium]
MDFRTLTLLENTLLLSGSVCALSVPVGVLLGWLFFRSNLPGRKIGLAVVVGMVFVPLYLQAAAWEAGFGLQGWFTLATEGAALLNGWRGAIWIHTLAAIPWVTVIAGLGMRRIERELEEQALLDGPARKVFFHVTLRGSLPAVGLAALWVVVTTAGEMTVTDLFMIRTYAEEVYTQMAVGQEPGIPTWTWVGIAAAAVLIAVGWNLAVGFAPRRRPLTVRQPFLYPLGKWKWFWLVAVVGFLILLAVVPLESLFYKAGLLVEQTATGRVRSFSPAKCLRIIGTALVQNRRELGWSLLIGGLAAAASVPIGLGLAWWGRCLTVRLTAVSHSVTDQPLVGARRGFPWGWRKLWFNFQFAIFNLQFAILLAIPGPILGLCIIRLLNRPGHPWLEWLYDYSILAPWLALFLKSLPVATLVLWHGVRSIPQELLESAAVDGAGAGTRFWRIVVPLSWPAMLAAFFAALAVSLGELAASILVVPPGVWTLSILIFNLLHYGVEDQVAGICLALVGLFALVAAAAAVAVRFWQRRLRGFPR